ncbi:MAG: NAD-glutamate dehydrogenase domain-containing protein, partial [Desertimonas sp.]
MQVHPDVIEALARLRELAGARRPDDDLLPEFLDRYYGELPDDDVGTRPVEEIYASAVDHLELGRVRRAGQPIVRVLSPEREPDGWRSARSVVLVVSDDMPFLVDTLRLVVERHDLGIHLLVHPMLPVERDAHDVLVGVGAPGGVIEAWTQIEIDRVDDDIATMLTGELADAVADVRRVVDDFDAMRHRMLAQTEVDPLLTWFAGGNFVFLGSAVYDRDADGSVVVRPGSELGMSRVSVRAARPRSMPGRGTIVIARTDDHARVFKAQRQTVVCVRPDGPEATTETRFVGLLTSNAVRGSVLDIPRIGPALSERLDLSESRLHTHAGREARNVLENLPRDLVLEQSPDTTAELVADIVGLQERRLVRVFEVPEPVGAWVTVFVYLPKARFTADLPTRIADTVAAAYGSEERSFEPYLGANTLARIAIDVRRPDDRTRADADALERTIDEVSTSWSDRVMAALRRELDDDTARRLFERVGRHAPASYRAATNPELAVDDLRHVLDVLDGGRDEFAVLAHDVDAPADEWRVKVFRRGSPASLADLLPVLDHLGLHALDERPSTFRTDDGRVHLYDIGVRMPADVSPDAASRHEVEEAFGALLDGSVEGDGFNRLVLGAGLTIHEVAVIRAYGKYLRQIGFAFSQQYVEEALGRHPRLVVDLIALFQTRFDPQRFGVAEADARAGAAAVVRERLGHALDDVPSLDDDRICRAFLSLIDATVRTNAARRHPTIAFKFDPAAIPDLPVPRPRHEIWVCSPRVEGVHLRGGAVARGGLRWSDRREDFRTEVLGLMKAQMVKNAVIVPSGAKGGFVVKRPPPDPESLRAEVVECYRLFIRGLLDLTDNRISTAEGEVVVPPPGTVVHDGEDSYLVVAADKGTASFSDIANAISEEYGFWLGDAFASGGSTGYDHKAMGITARGAWESVRRHARVLGKDADRDPITVVGIGDMSGDVFGNGMLMSASLRLVAAFDHRHIFVDPNPDPAVGYAERQRLFGLARSSWEDYDSSLLSPGGAVYARSLKSIELSDEARATLAAPAGRLTPSQVISAILRAPVDLLWNGGIGTYVKSATETDADVGDRANDAVRVEG